MGVPIVKTAGLNPAYNELLVNLLHRLLQKIGQPEEAQALLCEELRKITGARLAALFFHSEAGNSWRSALVKPAKYHSIMANCNPAFWEQAAQTSGAGLWQIDHRDKLIRLELQRLKAANCLVIPLVSGAAVDGILFALDTNLTANIKPLAQAFTELATVLSLILSQTKPNPALEELATLPTVNEEKELLQQIATASPVGIVTVNPKGEISYANQRAEQILGLSRTEITQRFYNAPEWRITKLDGSPFPEEDLPFARVKAERKTIFDVRHTIFWPDGHRVILSVNGAPLYSPAGEFAGMVSIIEDITERCLLDQHLQESEARFKELIEKAPLPVVISRHGIIVYSNPKCLKMLGLEDGELLLGHSLLDWIAPEDHATIVERIARREAEEYLSTDYETIGLRTDGSRFPMRYSVSRVQLSDGPALLAFLQDITDQKEAGNELRASEAKYRRFLDTAIEGVWMVDENAHTTFANNRLAELLGYSLEEIMAKSYPDFLFPEDLMDYEANVLQRRQGLSQRHERRFRRHDGSTLWTIVASVPTIDANGAFLGSFAMITDISGLKQAEAALRESELRFRSLFEQAAIGVAQVETATGRYLRVNKRYCEIVGYSEADLAKLSFQKITHPDDLEADLANMKRLITGETREFTMEKRYRRKDGRIIWAQLTVTPMWELGGKLDYHIAVVEDITSRKEAETALTESQRQLATLIANLPGIVYRCRNDRDWTMEFISNGCQELTGYNPEDFILSQRLNYNDLILPEDQALVRKVIQQSVKERNSYELSYRIRTVQGRIRWVWERGAGVYDDKGRVLALEGFITDISDRQQAESALRESEERYRSLFEQSVVGLGIFTPDGRVFAANAALERLTGFTETELKALGTRAFFHRPQDRPALLAELKNKSQLKNFETTLRRKDGATFDASLNVAQIHLGNDSFLQVSCQDISERKQAEDEIYKLNAELDQRVQLRTTELNAANKELESFAYAVSHDLRAPLRGIDGWSQALLEDYQEKLDEQGKEYLHTVRSEAQRMGRLIDALLSLSRINRSEMKRQQLDLSEIVHEIATDLQRREPERTVAFHITPKLITIADPDLLLVLLRNLIGNAWKFTSRREHAVISFGVEKQEDEIVYFVQDNGAGFDMQFAAKIFTPFQRLHHQEEFPGTGIGLATVQRIIHRHGGRIWTDGKLDEGAVFYFTLPNQTEDGK
jgi:PAS domain S-box-containing protein